MSVPKCDRGESKMEFYHNAIVIQTEVIKLLLKDFGLKKKVRTIEILTKMYNMDTADEQELRDIMSKYHMDSAIIDEYPEWLINYFRESMLLTLRDMMNNIRAANGTYVMTREEYGERRLCWDRAINNCNQLIGEMECVITMLPETDAEKYMPLVKMIKKEIDLLKGVRKSDNKMLGRL